MDVLLDCIEFREKMFTDSNTVSLGFSPHLESSRHFEDKPIQTIGLSGIHKDCQSKSVLEIGIQTTNNEDKINFAYDEKKCATFLKTIYPNFMNELDNITKINASILNCEMSEENSTVQKVSSFYLDKSRNISVSGLCWSCTANVIAVGFSYSLHSSWCCHTGLVAVFNVEIDIKTPIWSMDVSSCVRAVSMHPLLPSILAVGTFSGEVLIWDISHGDPGNTFVNRTGTRHLDSITELHWRKIHNTATILASSALDGQVIMWKVLPQLGYFELLERFCCGKFSEEAGVTCFGFPKGKDDVFIAALEGGMLLLCGTTLAEPIFNVSACNPEDLKKPIITIYSELPATALYVEFSPFHEDKFATISTDQAIRIFSLSNGQALSIIFGSENIIGMRWCLFQEDLLVCWGDKANFKLFSSESGKSPGSYFLNDELHSNSHISVASFCSKSTNLVAVGSLEGVVNIWHVPARVHLNVNP